MLASTRAVHAVSVCLCWCEMYAASSAAAAPVQFSCILYVAGHLYLSATSYGPLAAGPHTPVSAQRRAVARCRACWLLHGPGHVQHMAARGVCTCGVLTVVALAGYRAQSALHTL